jgi:spore germination cell wall hydrolase CwlJ-like protein
MKTAVEYFHNGSVKPKWAGKMELITVIGGHKFYRSIQKESI